MKLEVGMYVRTPYGIDKIKDIVLNGNLYEDSGLYLEKGIKLVCGKEEMKNLKASYNIIDLIEAGDYVNGDRIDEIENGELRFHWDYGYSEYISYYENEDIKSIVTKEQFESMSYKVGDKQ